MKKEGGLHRWPLAKAPRSVVDSSPKHAGWYVCVGPKSFPEALSGDHSWELAVTPPNSLCECREEGMFSFWDHITGRENVWKHCKVKGFCLLIPAIIPSQHLSYLLMSVKFSQQEGQEVNRQEFCYSGEIQLCMLYNVHNCSAFKQRSMKNVAFSVLWCYLWSWNYCAWILFDVS